MTGVNPFSIFYVMKKLLILIALFVSFIHADCKPVDLDEAQKLNYNMSVLLPYSMTVTNGVDCDHGKFLNGYTYILQQLDFCFALTYEDKKMAIIIEIPPSNNIMATAYFDEYGMIVKREKFDKTKLTCIDLYNKFKQH